MADKRPLDDRELEALFGAARDAAPQAGPDLLARVMADAEAEADAREAAVRRPIAARRRGLLATIVAALGGWPAAAGLAAATLAGLAIGLASPETLDSLASDYLYSALGDNLDVLMPSYGDLLQEG